MKKILLLLSIVLITGQVFAQSKKTKKTTKKTTKTITTTTTTTSTAKEVKEENLEPKSSLLPEDQKKIDLAIGKKLSGLVKSDSLKANTSGGITVRRYISNEEGKFGADILEPSSDSKYSTESIKSIISGYISDNFEYSPNDADLLSDYVISYNTANRKAQDYVIQNYSTNVVLATKKEKIGYEEKPAGKTQILIPTEKNLIKKLALDVHALELLHGSKSELALTKDGQDKVSKFNTFYLKKLSSENEEVNSKMVTATPAEIKGFSEKLANVKLRQEMNKENFTSEKEYLESKKSKTTTTSTTTTTTVSSSSSSSNGIIQAVNAPELPRNKFTTFIYGFNHPGINAREFMNVPNIGIISIGYDAAKLDKKELQVFITSNGDYLLKKSSEGIKIPETSPLIYSAGKIYVFETLKNETYLIQFNQDLEFESRTENSISPNSTVQVIGEEVILTTTDKATNKTSVKIYKVKDLTTK